MLRFYLIAFYYSQIKLSYTMNEVSLSPNNQKENVQIRTATSFYVALGIFHLVFRDVATETNIFHGQNQGFPDAVWPFIL